MISLFEEVNRINNVEKPKEPKEKVKKEPKEEPKEELNKQFNYKIFNNIHPKYTQLTDEELMKFHDLLYAFGYYFSTYINPYTHQVDPKLVVVKERNYDYVLSDQEKDSVYKFINELVCQKKSQNI